MKQIIFVASILIASTAFAGGGSSIGPGNPAALNCTQLGGQLQNFKTTEGDDANCVLDEWVLFNEMSARNLVKVHNYGNGQLAMPNPAAVNCTDIGGKTSDINTPNGQEGICTIEEWALFNVIDVVHQTAQR